MLVILVQMGKKPRMDFACERMIRRRLVYVRTTSEWN